MSRISITELGRKWYGVSVKFSNDEIDRVSPDALRGMGGKLRYDIDGGFRALFHFNVTRQDNNDTMIKVLKYFGDGGYFSQGVDLTTDTSASACESETAIKTVLESLASSCKKWSQQWMEITSTALIKKTPRITLLRKLADAGITHISEDTVREYAEDFLRNKYQSALFVETFMWRLGWPDKRKPFSSISLKPEIKSAVS